jgi:hypothetical protein
MTVCIRILPRGYGVGLAAGAESLAIGPTIIKGAEPRGCDDLAARFCEAALHAACPVVDA